MANTIKIKRSNSTATPGSLAEGELAISFLSEKLYVGNSTAVIPIAGKHYPGTLTANQALVANSSSGIDKVITANLTTSEIHANGAVGTAGYLLVSGGAGSNVYWFDPSQLQTAVGGSNTQIQFNDSGDLGASASFSFDKDTNKLTVGNSTVNVAVNTSSVTVGSELTINTSAYQVGNSTVNASLTSSVLTIGSSTVNSTALASNLASLTDSLTVGNSTVNSVVNSTAISTNTASLSGSVTVGSDVTLNTSTLFIGNSTVNTTVTAGNIALQGTQITLGANVTLDAERIFFGNSTVNTVVNSSGLFASGGLGNTVINGWANITGEIVVGGNASISGNLLANGNVQLGDAFGVDVVSFVATVNTEITPSANNTQKLGRSDLRWGEVNANNVLATNVTVNSTITVGTVVVNSSALFVGNSSVNTVITGSSIDVDGTVTASNGSFGDLSVSGNLTVTGTLTTIDTTNLVIKDPMIKLANNNTADTIDIGIYGQYDNGGSPNYLAFFRDQSDSGKFKLYTGLTNEPSTTVDLTGGTLGTLVLGTLELTSITLSTPLGVDSGGTGANTFTTRGVIYGNGTSALQVTAAGTEGQVLQANSTGYPVFADLDGGTF